MAKNEGIPTVTAGIVSREREGQGGVNLGEHTFLRKDTHFFVNGNWYVTITCPMHGVIDEEITWADAKTPHHAGLIADERHAKCCAAAEAKMLAEVARAEINAAVQLRDQQKQNVKTAAARLYEVKRRYEKDIGSRVLQAELADAERNLRRHEHAMVEAERRVVETRKANAR